ncbi:hypothetical protein [Paenibacillus sp. FSL H3-0286]|uniref:hypothetical protein n=1 Tax=Paenibacillus sp. FSL H3-0286 TaxID=2921427 RepID=UPI00324EE2F5
MTKYSIEKDISEVYRIRLDSHRCQWATLTINNGDLNVISDCGNFNYSWRMNKNENFKELLIRICKHGEGKGYLYDKIHDRNRANRVDTKKSIEPLKKELFEYYREKKRDWHYMEQDKKKYYPLLDDRMRDAYDELVSIESEGELSMDAFHSLLWNNSYLDEVFDGDYFAHCLDVEYIGDRQAIAFCEVVAPVFAEILMNELKEAEPVSC